MDSSSEIPPFDPRGSRYDQSTFAGRLSHFREVTDPLSLFTSKEELQASQALLASFERGEAKGVSDAALWNAKRVVDGIIHPVTGEEMFFLGRMSAFVPTNTIPTLGMLTASSPAATIFWQWANQSNNVLCNYVNRSGASIDATQVATAYALAVTVSCGVAVGAQRLVQSGPPIFKRFRLGVPYAAVVCAGSANLGFTRLPEMQSGVPVRAKDGTPLGLSQAAAKSAVASTILSRIVMLPIAPLLVPPLAMAGLRRAVPALKGAPAVAVELGIIASTFYFALPPAIALFPQEMTLPVSSLEAHFQGLTDGSGEPVLEVLCNKGL